MECLGHPERQVMSAASRFLSFDLRCSLIFSKALRRSALSTLWVAQWRTGIRDGILGVWLISISSPSSPYLFSSHCEANGRTNWSGTSQSLIAVPETKVRQRSSLLWSVILKIVGTWFVQRTKVENRWWCKKQSDNKRVVKVFQWISHAKVETADACAVRCSRSEKVYTRAFPVGMESWMIWIRSI